MTLTKEKFVKYIEFIKTQCLNQDKFIDALELLSPHTYCDAFIYSSYENTLLELIEDLLDDDEDDIGYFLYEMGYLNKDLKNLENLPRDDNGNILYDSPETLYDYLVGKMKKGKEE